MVVVVTIVVVVVAVVVFVCLPTLFACPSVYPHFSFMCLLILVAWIASQGNTYQHVIVNLTNEMKITEVAVQSANNGWFTRQMKIFYSLDNLIWRPYISLDKKTVLNANSARNQIIRIRLIPEIKVSICNITTKKTNKQKTKTNNISPLLLLFISNYYSPRTFFNLLLIFLFFLFLIN